MRGHGQSAEGLARLDAVTGDAREPALACDGDPLRPLWSPNLDVWKAEAVRTADRFVCRVTRVS